MTIVFPMIVFGCASDDQSAEQRRLAAEGAQLFGGAPTTNPSGGPDTAATPGATPGFRPPAWRVVLFRFSGEEALSRARSTLPMIQAGAELPEAFVEAHRDGAVIALGAYGSPSDQAAQLDLKRIRAILIDGRPAFPNAMLLPPESGANGLNPEFNVANIRETFGASARFTLQIGVYESENRMEAMRLAEQAVEALRQDGELAFYYHGPNRSMVTIGVFTDRDYDPARGRISDEIRILMKKHAENLYNGAGVRERLLDGSVRMQASRLVEIP